MVACYSTKRESKRWPMIILLDVSAYNVYVSFAVIERNWNRNKLYRRPLSLEKLKNAQVTLYAQERKRLPRTLCSREILKKSQKQTDVSGSYEKRIMELLLKRHLNVAVLYTM